MFYSPSGRHTKFEIILRVITIIVYMVWLVWETKRVYRYKNMKMRMTKHIDVVIVERLETGSKYVGEPYKKYNYIFSGLDEYQGVIFNDRSLRVKKKYEKGETVSLLINEYNLEEFWFEEAVEPWKKIPILWVLVFLAILLYVLLIRMV